MESADSWQPSRARAEQRGSVGAVGQLPAIVEVSSRADVQVPAGALTLATSIRETSNPGANSSHKSQNDAEEELARSIFMLNVSLMRHACCYSTGLHREEWEKDLGTPGAKIEVDVLRMMRILSDLSVDIPATQVLDLTESYLLESSEVPPDFAMGVFLAQMFLHLLGPPMLVILYLAKPENWLEIARCQGAPVGATCSCNTVMAAVLQSAGMPSSVWCPRMALFAFPQFGTH